MDESDKIARSPFSFRVCNFLPNIFSSFQKNAVEFFLLTGSVPDWTPSQSMQFVLYGLRILILFRRRIKIDVVL